MHAGGDRCVRQSREHLFMECICWNDDIRRLWKDVERIAVGMDQEVIDTETRPGREFDCHQPTEGRR